ncbi:MAG TPA: biotin/lipoyl-binding protein [Bacillota bacterium]|jgi:biotin carboxyl carrier protein|nr:biotin/lipoyl-binding protein [Bacillota bacterium]HQC47902.1 biotin/lipoyl-binding protein [Bacillota bacterium]
MSIVKTFRVVIDGEEYFVEVEEVKAESSAPVPRSVKAAPAAPAPVVSAPKAAAPPATSAGGDIVKAPLQGTILSVDVAPGDQVKAGDNLVVIEAMKMENEIVAPHDGEIAQVHVERGVVVSSGDLLVTFK